ncbi:MAG TPA: MFS transporter [Actinomycetota bacterium]|nr:MFS transporter [Actinomycetota bacterium]
MDLSRTVRRNTILLAACLALSWAVVQLLVTVAAPVLSDLTGRPSLAGFGPGITLAFWAVATLVVGRYMDSHGRVAGLRLGFIAGVAGCLLLFFAIRGRSLPLYLLGLSVAGGGGGAVNLARAGAGDMYPPERRARGISFVLIGAAFGAILGPVVFTPLLVRSGADFDVLAPPFIAAALIMAAGIALTYAIRVDPMEVARRQREEVGSVAPPMAPARHIRELLRVPLVRAAVIAALISQGVMAMMMSTVSLHLRDHAHDWTAVSIALSAHFLGMFGLVLFVGRIVDRIGRERSLVLGLVVLVVGVVALLGEVELLWVAPAMLIVGVGWNVSFVAATAMMADATGPAERAGLLGFADFLAMGSSVVSSLLAGVAIGILGIGALVAVGVAVAMIPVVMFLAGRHRVPAAA